MAKHSQNDKGFFAGVMCALAVVEVHGQNTVGRDIANAAGPDFLKAMAEYSGIEQYQRLVEKYCN